MAMALPSFLKMLRERGRVLLSSAQEPSPEEQTESEAILRDWERDASLSMAFVAPALNLEAALWAAGVLYRGCQFLVFREIDAATVREALARPCPKPNSPAVVYSVDLTLRYLPNLVSLARGVAVEDPLVVGLLALAQHWPLSSVGIPGVTEVNMASWAEEPSLWQLYIDRIIEHRDIARLAHPRVKESVRQAMGCFPGLAPEVAAALAKVE